MELVREKLSKRNVLNHLIFIENLDPSTYASALLLKQYYQDHDISFIRGKDWRYLFIVKRTWLRHVKNNGHWTCHYCGTKLYKLPKRNKNRQSVKDCVTIDHKIAASKTEDPTDSSNFLECCFKCNRDKKDMSYEKFIKTISYP